jgi:hypothetical protein
LHSGRLWRGLPTIAAGAISQGYQTTATTIAAGTLVSLESSKSSVVGPATTNNTSGLVGIAADKPLVQLSSSDNNIVQVVVGGVTSALVSDINGPVKTGDKITISPVTGIGMKATNAVEIVGTADADLTSVHTITKTVAAQDGKTAKSAAIKVGLLPVAVSISFYSAGSVESTAASLVPPFLQAFADVIAGKSVSPLRVLLVIFVLIAAFGIVAIMLTTSIRTEINSIGRNPLASRALLRSLVDVIVAAIGILLISATVTYFILRG